MKKALALIGFVVGLWVLFALPPAVLFTLLVATATFALGKYALGEETIGSAKTAAKTALIFILLRYVFGQMLCVYPKDSWAGLGPSGGLFGLLWGGRTPLNLFWEISAALSLGGLAYLAARKKDEKAKAPFAMKLVAAVFALAFAASSAMIKLPSLNPAVQRQIAAVDTGLETGRFDLIGSLGKAQHPAPCPGVSKIDLGWYDKAYHESATVSLPRGCAVMVEVHLDPTAKVVLRFDNGLKNDLGVATKNKSWIVKAGDAPPSLNPAKDYMVWFWDPKGQSQLLLRADRT